MLLEKVLVQLARYWCSTRPGTVPYGPIKKKWHPIPVIQHLWTCCPLQVRTWTGRCQRGWWNFSWDCTARGSSARNLVAPSGSEALESNSGSIYQLGTGLKRCFLDANYQLHSVSRSFSTCGSPIPRPLLSFYLLVATAGCCSSCLL